MWYRKNVPGWEGWLRIVGGLCLAATGFVGFCPMCKPFGRAPLDKL